MYRPDLWVVADFGIGADESPGGNLGVMDLANRTEPQDTDQPEAAGIPTIADVRAAAARIRPHLPPTPMWSYPALNRLAGAELYVKHENVQPTGAFKVRGGINLLTQLPPDHARRGVIAYSTGNHGQSIAYASRLLGIRCRIVMPEGISATKTEPIRLLGAELVEVGARFDDAREYAGTLASETGARLISAANEPEIIAGVATSSLEMLTAEPDLDAVVVPVGSGTGAAAACLVAAALVPRCRVIGVQSAGSPAAYRSWRAGRCVTAPDATVAEGLATGVGFDLPQRVLTQRLTDFWLVDDDAIVAAMGHLLRHAHTLAELAGAAALAGVLTHREELAGRRVGVVCTGANASPVQIMTALAG